MTDGINRKDLIVVVPDSHAKATMEGLLLRVESLQIRSVSFSVQAFAHRDSGCLRRSHDFLRGYINLYDFALVMFDREGCGQDEKTRIELEKQVESNLNDSGWKDRSAAVVFDPELEIWVWSESRKVDQILGWSSRTEPLRQWLVARGYLREGMTKPSRPKEAMIDALREVRKAQSASVFSELAKTVSLKRCIAPSFGKLISTLQGWFPAK